MAVLWLSPKSVPTGIQMVPFPLQHTLLTSFSSPACESANVVWPHPLIPSPPVPWALACSYLMAETVALISLFLPAFQPSQ